MVAQDVTAKDRVIALLDELPQAALNEVVTFVEFQRYKVGRGDDREDQSPPYVPTPMGGLWAGHDISTEDIAEARAEMWSTFADADQ